MTRWVLGLQSPPAVSLRCRVRIEEVDVRSRVTTCSVLDIVSNLVFYSQSTSMVISGQILEIQSKDLSGCYR